MDAFWPDWNRMPSDTRLTLLSQVGEGYPQVVGADPQVKTFNQLERTPKISFRCFFMD